MRRSLEEFSRDLLLLVKSAPIYPDGHPTVEKLCERLASWRPADGSEVVELVIYPLELVTGGRSFGGEGTRVSELASLFFRNDLRSATINCGQKPVEVKNFALGFAGALAAGEAQFRKFLAGGGLISVECRVADAAAAVSQGQESSPGDLAERIARAQNAWMWLQRGDAPPEALAGALSTPELWATGDHSGATRLAEALLDLGGKLEDAHNRLAPDERHALQSRLSVLGKQTDGDTLKHALLKSRGSEAFGGAALNFLLQGMGVENLVEAMAGVLAAEGPKSGKLVALYSRFSSRDSEKALALVRARVASGDRFDDAANVWQNLEAVLLGIDDVTFSEGSEKPGRAWEGGVVAVEAGSIHAEVDFTSGPEENLDYIFVALALSGGSMVADGWEALYGRIAAYANVGDIERVLALVEKVDAITPVALDYKPDLLTAIVDIFLSIDVKPSQKDRQQFTRFTDRHREALAETLIAKLAEAQRVSHRKLLVEVLSGLSKDMTPLLVSRARRGPWFMTRNLLIILGRRADPTSLPYVATAADHVEPRIAKQALRSLAAFGQRGREALRKFAADGSKNQELRVLAEVIAGRMAQ